MFDIGFSELIVIAIVALVVIGPERLPRVARTAGLLFGRMQRYVNDVKADISREIQLDELKRLQADMQASARDFERSVTEGMQSVEQSVRQAAGTLESEVKKEIRPITDGVAAPSDAPDTNESSAVGETVRVGEADKVDKADKADRADGADKP